MKDTDKRYWTNKLNSAQDVADLVEIIKGILNDLPVTEESK